MRFSVVSSALVAALVGYGASVAIVISAATALSATPAQTASWIFVLCLGKAVGSAFLSAFAQMPVVLAWSTPGAALIAATNGVTMAEGVGAFLLAGVLIALTGAFRPLGRLIAMIPDGIAAAMLAGVLLPFCVQGALAAQALPDLILPMIAAFLLVRLRNPAMAVLAALAVGLLVAFAFGTATLPPLRLPVPAVTFITPEFRPDVLIGLGVPLYLITMASQNLPGFATLRAAGFEPPVRAALAVTGGLSAVAAFFGAHTVSVAAITAAICLGDDVHPDRSQRWKVGLAYGAIWVVLGLLSPLILTILAALPRDLMAGLVALALIGPLSGALSGAMTQPATRFAATVTLAVTASGVAAFGVGAAFWGLMAGLLVYGVERMRKTA